MSDERWFVTDGQSQSGPLTLEGLREELARPGRGLARVVWREGMKEWTAPDLVPELAAPPPPPSRPEPREPMFTFGMKDPKWFMVGAVKLAVMMVATFGLYQLYWFYKQWDRVRDAGDNVSPAPRSLFGIVFCYSLFRRIIDSTHAVGVSTRLPPSLLAVGFILPSLMWRADGPQSYLGFLAFVPLVAVQRIANAVALGQGSTEDRNTRLTWLNWVGVVVAGGLMALLALATLLQNSGLGQPPTSKAYLASVARIVNTTLPKKLDRETVLVETEGLEGVLVYRYRMVNRSANEMDAGRLVQDVRPSLVTEACTSQTRQTLLDRGVTVRHSYRGKDGREVVAIDIVAADCADYVR
ncbi:MAG TPA: DUF4339 domain-containing protein [Vicinamibacteria bacterium]|nr:DUF4339 domain-containing protein [Vicinamibacteria bacterium]